MKKFGVLCPVFSLPSKYGIGDFGQAAYDFVDFLHDEGYNLWEVLPLGKVNGTSPYSCLLVHGFDEMFVDLDDLVGRGLLTMAECERAQSTLFGQVDYLNKSKKEELFALAYDRADDKLLAKLQAFARANTYFIDYGYMMVLGSRPQRNCGSEQAKMVRPSISLIERIYIGMCSINIYSQSSGRNSKPMPKPKGWRLWATCPSTATRAALTCS